MSPYPGWVWDLVDLAAAQTAGDAEEMDRAFERLESKGRAAEVEEALLQSYLFLGFPAAIEAFRLWRMRGAEPPSPAAADWDLWAERGQEVCARVYDGHYERLRENIARLHPDLDRWMVEEGYGKVLGRPGLDLDVRELCIVAMLVVEGPPARRQLRSHLQGAVNVGVPPGEVEAALDRAGRFAPPEHVTLARKLWSMVRDRVG